MGLEFAFSIFKPHHSPITQLVEFLIVNQAVSGSNPDGRATLFGSFWVGVSCLRPIRLVIAELGDLNKTAAHSLQNRLVANDSPRFNGYGYVRFYG